MKRIWYKSICGILILGALLAVAGCQGGPSGASVSKGTLTINVTDAPPKTDVTSIMVTLSSVEVHRAALETTQSQDAGQSGDGGEWVEIVVPSATKTFDLLKVQGVEQLLASTQVAAGKYTQIRLTVERAEVATGGGTPKPATVQSKTLKIVHPFNILAGEITTLTLDFDAAKSVIVTGQNNIMVKPVINLLLKPAKSDPLVQISKENSRKAAEDFVRNSPTFIFDGMISTLVLTDSETLTASSWRFTYAFDCQHPGYGDRSGQTLSEVITHHQAVITVEKGSVTDAVLDGSWDEITQEEIAAN